MADLPDPFIDAFPDDPGRRGARRGPITQLLGEDERTAVMEALRANLAASLATDRRSIGRVRGELRVALQGLTSRQLELVSQAVADLAYVVHEYRHEAGQSD